MCHACVGVALNIWGGGGVATPEPPPPPDLALYNKDCASFNYISVSALACIYSPSYQSIVLYIPIRVLQ